MVALLKRLLYILPVIWLVVSMVFLLIHLVPGDPVQQMLGEGATASDLSALRHQYGLDAPLSEQYLHYWRGVLHGDLGRSLRLNDSVSHLSLIHISGEGSICRVFRARRPSVTFPPKRLISQVQALPVPAYEPHHCGGFDHQPGTGASRSRV